MMETTPSGPVYQVRRVAPGQVELTRDGRAITPHLSQSLRNHSPDGFEYGYGGSGPAQLALAILLDVYGPESVIPERHYQDFKWAHVAPRSGFLWHICTSTIVQWVAEREQIRERAEGRRIGGVE